MAEFTALHRLKPIFMVDEMSQKFEPKDVMGLRSRKIMRPINVVCWKRAICLEFMEKADVLEYYDQTVNSPNGSFYIPAVLRITSNLIKINGRIHCFTSLETDLHG
nr:HNH endonuclease [Tanacetum cinerariifolium]